MADLKNLDENWTEGGEATLRAMSDEAYMNIGQQTLSFVRRIMRNPEMAAIIKAEAAKLEAANGN